MKNQHSKKSTLLILLLLCLAANVFGQETNPDEESINVDTLLLNVPVIVGDREGRYLGGLKQNNFYIVEDGIKRPVDFFADDSAPLNVAILIDTSGSTQIILDEIKDSARDFIKVLRPEDKALIASFDNTTKIWSEFTSDQKQLKKAIGKISGGGGSTMYDAMYLIMKKHFASLKGRKAIIVLTDGMVFGRGVSESILLNTLAESDIIVYPLLFTTTVRVKAINPEMKQYFEKSRRQGFDRMNLFSLATGGKIFDAEKTNFRTAFQNIADELKKQYVIGFYPTSEKENKVFKIGLNLDRNIPDPNNVVLRSKRVIRYKPLKR